MATDPACLQALAQLSTILDRRGIMSALIGGMALQLLQPLATARVTHDIDLALLVESFDEYEEIRSELLAIGWTAEPEEHRLRTREGCLVDLLPYPRKDVVDDHVILPRSKTPLNVAGMVEAIVASKPVLLGGANHIRVSVAPIAAQDGRLGRAGRDLDIFWLRDESVEDSASLPPPDVLAEEIIEDLRAALEQFEEIGTELRLGEPSRGAER